MKPTNTQSHTDALKAVEPMKPGKVFQQGSQCSSVYLTWNERHAEPSQKTRDGKETKDTQVTKPRTNHLLTSKSPTR